MAAWLQTISGRPFIYEAPVVETGHILSEVAVILARTPRFGGHTFCTYTVTQHSVLCADAAIDLYDDDELAAFCLLHDAHETWTGDITRPMQGALIERVAMGAAVDPTAVQMVAQARATNLKLCFKDIQRQIDAQVFAAAGLNPARFDHHAERVKEIDARALRTERDQLMRRPPMPWDAPIEMVAPLPVRSGFPMKHCAEADAEQIFLDALHALCPAFQLAGF